MSPESKDAILKRSARSAWYLLVFIGGIVVAVAYLGDLDTRRARAAAEEVVRPVASEVGQLRNFRDSDERLRRSIIRKLDALCRATPQANCPLGED